MEIKIRKDNLSSIGHTNDLVGYHCYLPFDAGLLEVVKFCVLVEVW